MYTDEDYVKPLKKFSEKSRKKHKPVILFHMLILFLPTSVRAEELNIYVGDLIELKINTSAYSLEELREKFDGFEIVALEQTPDGALITLRTFETGEKTVVLGDKQIVIRVQSTLDNYQREDVFEGDLNAQSPGFMPDWRIPAGLSALVFLLSGAFLVIKLFQKRKPVPPLNGLSGQSATFLLTAGMPRYS